jgi:aryl-alcohol dehydrogenase-like predicted oxidoreductase
MVWGYGSGYTDSDLHTAFEICSEAGVKFYDTAEVYGFGQSEELLGQFIQQAGKSGQMVVATKWFPYPWRLAPRRSIPNVLERSLKRLGMDQVDLYQVHWPSPLVGIEAAMDGMATAVKQGLTKGVGVSNYSAGQMRQAHAALAKHGISLATNQIEYSLIHRQPESNGLIDTCRELGVTVIAYSPMGMGMLTGKYTPDHPPTGSRSRRYNKSFLEKLQPLIALMREVGQGHGGKTPAQVAINWVIARGAIPIPGVKNIRQAEDNIEAINWALTDDEVSALNDASADLSK